MENFKFILSSIFGILILVLFGYWAVNSIETGSLHVDRQTQKELMDQNRELAKEIEDLKNELRKYQTVEEVPPAGVGATPTPTPEPAPVVTASKYQNLIDELQKLVDDKIQMKVGSKGTRVGTVQNFLNIYNNTTKRVDNDYGKTLKADVAAFQKKEGLTADGEAGTATFQKMIDWLEKQS